MSPENTGSGPTAEAIEAEPLGLALSGGGVRAALFSLGVIIGLIEGRCHTRVRCIASVSGGSILNAALAHARSLSGFSKVDEFEPLASKLAARLAQRGAFAFDWRSIFAYLLYALKVIARAFLPLALVFGTLAQSLREQSNLDLSKIDWGKVPWPLVGSLVLIVVMVSILLSRGLFQQAEYASVLQAVGDSTGGSLNVRDWGGTPADAGSAVMHVLVATDLLSGEPMYFSRQFLHCRPYGWSAPGKLRTAAALYSSAAFPAVFPPMRLRLSRFDFQNGEMSGALPSVVRLADGGVYNNLGTDWFDVLEGQKDLLWPFGELKVNPPQIKTNYVVVVNASAPSRMVRRLGPFPVARIMSVLYDNTVRPRVRMIQGENRPLIDIDESPIQMAKRLAKLEGESGRRAQALLARLGGRTDQFWADFKHETAGTETKLSRAGRRTSARLMLHGYLLALVLLHVRFNAELPKKLRGEEYFLDLVGGSKNRVASPDPDAVREKPAAEKQSGPAAVAGV